MAANHSSNSVCHPSAYCANGHAELLFDGAYMNVDVWINGHHLGNHPYGYTAFAFDLAPFLKKDGDSVLVVKINNFCKNSRLYSG
jgi:beta-galactosidase